LSGDFNLYVYDPCSIYAKRFNEILESCNLKQHIFDPVISDHCAVHCNLRVRKPHFTTKKVYYRKLLSLDIESFCVRYFDLSFATGSSC
ncbi:unnamed protein product, partial [Porites lobata]